MIKNVFKEENALKKVVNNVEKEVEKDKEDINILQHNLGTSGTGIDFQEVSKESFKLDENTKRPHEKMIDTFQEEEQTLKSRNFLKDRVRVQRLIGPEETWYTSKEETSQQLFVGDTRGKVCSKQDEEFRQEDKNQNVGVSQQLEAEVGEDARLEDESESFYLLCSSIEISLEHYFNTRSVYFSLFAGFVRQKKRTEGSIFH
jgi:hypothetical protein